ncbi:hypothetical protein GCM10009117_11680 [Gangjinia marincola]|uniref:Peptidylprolyl isomerase n=1 Tax=Gangjinia marincola TaxID=578463 RepID=A0ABP3XRW1_9FLAO
MKNIIKGIIYFTILSVGIVSCGGDDDDGITTVPPRDRAEVEEENRDSLMSYLENHFYTVVENDLNPNLLSIRFDSITDYNEDFRTPIASLLDLEEGIYPRLEENTFSFETEEETIEYLYYVLKLEPGANTQVGNPTFADSTFLSYRGIFTRSTNNTDDVDFDGIPNEADVDYDGDDDDEDPDNPQDEDEDGINDDADADDDGVPGTDDGKLDEDNDGIIDSFDNSFYDNSRVFDQSPLPLWQNGVLSFSSTGQPGGSLITGYREGLTEFSGASSFMMEDDGTFSFSGDYGIGAIFIPSGLAYFANPPSGIPLYEPLIFSVQVLLVQEADHDNDGIPSYLEDLDEDRFVIDDDTDENTAPNFFDADDDGDGVLTRDEITIAENAMDDGRVTLDEIEFYENADGLPAYLDPDVTEDRSDTDED